MKNYCVCICILFFTVCTTFSQHLIAFKDKNGKYGFKNDQNETIIQPAFVDVMEFSEGLAAVQTETEDKWGYIDTTGKLIIAPIYYNANNFSESIAAVSIKSEEEHWGLVEEWIFIDKRGQQVIDKVFDRMAGIGFKEGMCPYIITANSKEEELDEDYTSRFLIGFINKKGEVVITPKYTEVDQFDQGIARVAIGDMQGFVDKEGKPLFPFITCNFIEGNGTTFKENGKVLVGRYDPDSDQTIEYYIDIKGMKVP